MTNREIVLKYYPDATALNIGCKKGNKKYYNIITKDGRILGKGKSSKAAWIASSRNIDK